MTTDVRETERLANLRAATVELNAQLDKARLEGGKPGQRAQPDQDATGVRQIRTAAAQTAVPGEEKLRSAKNASPPLDEVEAFLRRFVLLPTEHDYVALTLWLAHTHAVECFASTPRLAVLSSEPGSGKSRVLEVSGLLVPRAVHAVNCTPAYLFRKVSDDAGLPTILYDEIDTVFGPRAKKDNEDVRGMLNAGHRKGAVAGRAVKRGDKIVTEELPAYCPVAMAGLGDLPDTILTRSVVIAMRKKAPQEHVEPFRPRVHEPQAVPLYELLARWVLSVETRLTDSWPELPKGVTDRNADVWEPLVAIADAAGGPWPQRVRVAAVAHVALPRGRGASIRVRLLGDLRDCFALAGRDKISTVELLEYLNALEEAPWGDHRGKPLDPRGLASLLRSFDVGPLNVRLGDTVAKGYDSADLHDPWNRYLTAPTPDTSATSATSATSNEPLVPDFLAWYEETFTDLP